MQALTKPARNQAAILTSQNTNSIVVLENVTKEFEEGHKNRIVLNNASATFASGELTAIIGKSGTGKSTLLNLISGIDNADSGRIVINGYDITTASERERTLFRRKDIGFVFQFFNLLNTLTVWENIVLPIELASRDKISLEAGYKRAADLLNEVALLDRKDTYPDRLSGGEQQRVAIARALVHDPLLVLADEPTGNLDEKTGRVVLDLLDRLTRQAGKNLIMVTHSQDAAAIADRVLYLQSGVLSEN